MKNELLSKFSLVKLSIAIAIGRLLGEYLFFIFIIIASKMLKYLTFQIFLMSLSKVEICSVSALVVQVTT